MAKLSQILGSLMNEITQARIIADRNSSELRSAYQSDPFLKLLSVPTIEVAEIKLDLKLAILGSSVTNQERIWVIGDRLQQRVVYLEGRSNDDGQTLQGIMTYAGENDSIKFEARQADLNQYIVINALGGGGQWVIGDRSDQQVVALNLTSSDAGKTLNGTVQYRDDSLIAFQGVLVEGTEPTGERSSNSYRVTYPGAQSLTAETEDIDVEVVSDNLTIFPEDVLSSISITLDMTRT